ncbi:OmpA family protein [Yoonia sediminilitoris]|uniref:OOP family OmpA-OmpF porin n=1 Tax=Yoonia sediminilitoris TaxID=1286148 RepID=A0A2T6KIC1_9RHOB|nr:OmpA family protein [Yoonia sediminilitoris]PUB15464.1 OOP family OmpA-OmpF porin [Yoonia sediminilitoris]RCW96074.1 OOP family OmpA-OmpF porin [Yoonia sediminilitoris]
MRLSALFIRLIVFAIAGFGAVAAARVAVSTVETRSVIAVQESLVDQGYEWASVLGDGLQVILEGQAPTEATRFRAISAAGEMVDASRVIDNLSVVDSAQLAPPEFAIEILRNDSGVSLIGLMPADTDREALAARITEIADGQNVTDLLEVGDYPAADTWRPAMTYALRALALLPRSKISVKAGRVDVSAISDSVEEKRRLETALARQPPEGVRLAVSISAPRPVISPFTTRFTIDAAGPHFDACAADTEEAAAQIVKAATAAGLAEKASCTLALGAPSRSWGQAVAMAIGAVGQLGGGTVTVSDTDVTLIAPLGTGQGTFDDIVGALANNLPDVFALTAELPVVQEVSAEGPPQFTATRSPEGEIQLRGRVPDEVSNTVAENFALAKFGQNSITMRTRIAEGLPAGWSVRVLAAIEALSELSNGAVIVEPDRIQIKGKTGSQDASAKISRLMIDKLGQGAVFEISVEYVEQLDPIAGLPTPEECVEQIKVVTENRKITFDPSSAQISASALAVLDDIAEILKICGDLRIRVAGYTDSQGREEMNLNLSQQRAQSVLDALRQRRVPVSTFEAKGYGEADPIADNGTEEGREANRRIEFSLIVPEPTVEETTTLDELAGEAPVEDAPAEDTTSE